MADLTRDQVLDTLRDAIVALTPLRPDRAVLGNRETAWTLTDGAFRLDPTEWEDLGWYVGDARLRVRERVVVHLLHRVAADPRRSLAAAREGAAKIVRDVRLSAAVIGAGMVLDLGGPVTVVQAGDVIETEVPLDIQYDYAVTAAA